MVIITGDPPKMGDYPKATAVFDLDSVGLLKLVKVPSRPRDAAALQQPVGSGGGP